MSLTYPAHREADVPLRDGSTVHIRPVRPDDRDAVLGFLQGMSEESRWFRFFAAVVDLRKMAERSVDVDYQDRYALVATAGPEHRVVGHGIYLRGDEGHAEVAFAVADDYQGRGLGTILLGHLAEVAAEHDLAVFDADVLPENHRMIEVFRESGFQVRTRTEPGMIKVEIPVALGPEALERFEERERRSAVAAMRSFLWPRSVAVIGASRTRGSIGGEVFHNLVSAGFPGLVYPINAKAEVVQSVAAYPTIAQAPGPVDLAVIVVPAESVAEVARDCGLAGVRGLVVISAGFSETGEEGAARQRELLAVCREFGMRLIGPNCMGIINTAPEVQLNATFAPAPPPHGRVGFLSQSGALGLAVIDHASALGLGLSSFVSVGNKADVSGNDLLQYWEDDEGTDLMLLYLESFGNPRKFSRIARRVGRRKPVIAVKSGRSAAGARATSSHTGAVLAASDVTVDALFRQAGVIRTDTLAEMFDVASLLANQPPPRGNRMAIITNAGGPGILCADTAEGEGLEVVSLPEAVQQELRAFLPAEASVGNPVDMIASASAEDYGKAIRAVVSSDAVDAVIVIFIPPLATRSEDVARAIRAAAEERNGDVPLLTVFMQAQGLPPELQGIPSYRFPEDAARALAHAARYGGWRGTPEGRIPTFPDVRRDEAAGLIAAALADGPRWLPPDVTAGLLSCYGVPVADWRIVGDPEEAARSAAELGERVAVKAVAPSLVHKTEAGAVRLWVPPDEVAEVARTMENDVRGAGHPVERFLVQRMVPPGVEMLVGVVHDPVFGPVVACGAGGTAVELLKDVSVRIAPLTDRDAVDMVRELATYPLLQGYRGGPRANVPALEDLLLRVGTLVEDHPAVAEMDLNPVMALPEGAIVVDARIRVEMPPPPLPLAARRPA
ncbi:MAG: GNAT family N-acetyltransferase [Actinomycetota bacterium]